MMTPSYSLQQSSGIQYIKLLRKYQKNTKASDGLMNADLIELLIQQKDSQIQSELGEEELKNNDKFNVMESRLCKNRDTQYWFNKCSDCKKDFDKDKNGVRKVYRDSCGNPYCNDAYCIVGRISTAKDILKSYFYAFPTWREARQRWLHYVVGQERVDCITHEIMINFRKRVSGFLNYLRKELRNPHMIGILDISYDGETFYLHYHLAMRLRGYMNEEEINKVALTKFKVKYNRFKGENYSRKPQGLINYFANRLAGKFEHDGNGTSWLYSDFFSEKEYFDLFCSKKRFITKGFTSSIVKEVRKKIKAGLFNGEAVVSPKDTNIGNHRTCQHCGSQNFERIFVEKPSKKPPDPTSKQIYPGYEPIHVEVIKIK